MSSKYATVVLSKNLFFSNNTFLKKKSKAMSYEDKQFSNFA